MAESSRQFRLPFKGSIRRQGSLPGAFTHFAYANSHLDTLKKMDDDSLGVEGNLHPGMRVSLSHHRTTSLAAALVDLISRRRT